MQPWHRWREPLAVVLLVASTLMVVVRVVAFGLAVDAGNAGGLLGSIPGGDDLLLLATAAAVLWCATPAGVSTAGAAVGSDAEGTSTGGGRTITELSPHAWPIAITGLVVVGLTVLGWLALSVLNVTALVRWATPDTGFVLLVSEGVIRLAVPVVSLIAVILAVQRAAAARSSAAQQEQPSLPGGETAPVEDVPETSAPERLPAAWQADEATGAVWLTADDAAQGRPGLSWSEPAEPEALTQGWGTKPRSGSSDPAAAAGESAPTTDPRQLPPPADVDDDLR